MRVFSWLFLFFFFGSLSVFSQEKYTRHSVSKGETISEIAKQYNVKSSEIYELNPDARKGIKFKTVLLIPKAEKNKTSTSAVAANHPEKTHEVQPKETLYGITKKYNMSIEDLCKINPDLEKEGLKIGQIINISQTGLDNLATTTKPEKAIDVKKTNVSKKNVSKEEVVVASKLDEKMEVSTEGIAYEVLPKESFYSIAKQYGITVADLQKANPTLGTKALRVGQKIIVPVKENINSKLAVQKKEIKVEKEIVVFPTAIVEDKKTETEIVHEVLPKETKYGIAKEYGLTVAELEKQNPNIVKNLPIGYLLKIRSSKIIEAKAPVEAVAVKEELNKNDSIDNTDRIYDSAFMDQLILKASENIGTRYRFGGTTKDGFDCSGLMCATFGTFDIKLPRSSIEMASYGSKVDAQNAQKGDLIFFKTNGRRQINHVGMVVEVLDGEIKFIHSSSHGGVIISSTKESYYEKSLAQVNRVL